MKFVDAKKLHNGDEVIVKETKAIMTVVKAEVCDKRVILTLDDGNRYHHKEVK